MDDVSALIDFASSTESVSPASSAPTEETSPAPIETGEASVTEPIDVSPDNTDVDGEQTAGGEPGDDKPVDARTNPAAVRNALKKLRDMGPEFAPIARQLNDSFGRYNAYKSVFPKVADAQNAKALLDAVGGDAGLSSLQETMQRVSQTDQKLYSKNPTQQLEALTDLYEDMRSEGKQDAFGSLAQPFLDQLRKVDEKAYFSAMKPHFYQGLRDVGLPNVIQNLMQSLSGDAPNVQNAQSILQDMQTWFEDLKAGVDTASKQNLDPERQAFEQERTKFNTERTQQFHTECATQCDSHNNKALGSALKSYLKLPFFKGWSRESLVDLGAGLKQQLYSELTNDKSYQTQMDALMNAKNADKGKITSFHQQKVDAMASRIVKDLLNRRYPGFQKSAGGTAPKAKVAAPVTAGQPSQLQYVTSKPEWNAIDWSADPNKEAYIMGRAKLLTGKYVTWHASAKPKR